MKTLFVYPTIQKLLNKKCLLIENGNEDGRIWFGIQDAIKNYLSDNELDISQIDWKIRVRKNDTDYITIHATTLEDFEKQFYDLNVEW